MKYCFSKPADQLIGGFFFAFCLSAASLSSLADTTTPLQTRDQSPFVLVHGLPYASTATIDNPKSSRLSQQLIISNTLFTQSRGAESLYIDIETWQYLVQLDLSLAPRWMFRLQLPFIAHTPGLLDASIDAFHQGLGLDEDIRPLVRRDQLDIYYSGTTGTLYHFDTRQKDLGDMSLQLSWHQPTPGGLSLRHWISLKLPSGSAQKLTGSGHLDLALWSSFSQVFSGYPSLYGQVGLLYMSGSDVLHEIHKDGGFFSTLGLGFGLSSYTSIKTQLDFHSALYRSDLPYLDEALQLTVGMDFEINHTHRFDFALTEDLISGSSPDITLSLGWHHSF